MYGVGNKVSAINGVFDTVEETLGGDVGFVEDGIFVIIGDGIFVIIGDGIYVIIGDGIFVGDNEGW